MSECRVSKNSFWARYEGDTTCNAKGWYLFKTFIGVLAVGFILFLFADWQGAVSMLASITILAGIICSGAFINNKRLSAFFGKPYVKWPFLVLTAPLWLPFAVMVFGVMFFWVKVLKNLWLSYKDWRCKKSDKPNELWRKECEQTLAKIKRRLEDEQIRRELHDALADNWKHTLTHTGLAAFVLGNLWMLASVPGPRHVLSFPFMLALLCFVSWIAILFLLFLATDVAGPTVVRLSRRLAETRLGEFCCTGGRIASDLYHRVCRKIVVVGRTIGGFSVRRVFGDKELVVLLANKETDIAWLHDEGGMRDYLYTASDAAKAAVEKMSDVEFTSTHAAPDLIIDGQRKVVYCCCWLNNESFRKLFDTGAATAQK